MILHVLLPSTQLSNPLSVINHGGQAVRGSQMFIGGHNRRFGRDPVCGTKRLAEQHFYGGVINHPCFTRDQCMSCRVCTVKIKSNPSRYDL